MRATYLALPPDIDIWRAAHLMIELCDLDAGWRARQRADHLYEEGDIDGFHVWVRIVKAIKELQKIEPADKDNRYVCKTSSARQAVPDL